MGNNSGGCVGGGGGVGVGVHEVGVLVGGTVEWLVVCRRLERWLEASCGIVRGASRRDAITLH